MSQKKKLPKDWPIEAEKHDEKHLAYLLAWFRALFGKTK